MLSALLFSYAGFAGNEGKNLFQGPPVLMQSSLDPSTYTAEKLRKLAHPNLLYVNHDLLAEKLRKAGVKIPSSGIAPEDIKDFVNEVAYLIPSGDEPEGTFTKESKTFYSDRYGGIGMNDNFGSGGDVPNSVGFRKFVSVG